MGIEIVVIVGAVFVGSMIFPRSRRLIKGAIGLLFNNVEEANPEVLFQAAQDDYRKRVANYNNALASLASVNEQSKRQIAAKQDKLDTLTARIQANVDAGNTDLAAQLAGQHDALESDLAKNKEQYAKTDSAYAANVQNIKIAQQEYQKKVQSFQNKLAQSKIDSALSEAGAALQNVAFKSDDIGSSFNRAEEIIDKRSADAAGKARVVTDLGANADEVRAQESEQKALDKASLAKFLAKKNGQTAAPITATVTSEKQMGPVSVG